MPAATSSTSSRPSPADGSGKSPYTGASPAAAMTAAFIVFSMTFSLTKLN
jgi:hypothetical protein